MRDLDALLNSLVNIDRNTLIAILTSEAEAAQQLVNSARQRTASQRAKRHEAVERAARIGFCRSSSMARWRRRCPSATSRSANLLKTDCAFAVIHNQAWQVASSFDTLHCCVLLFART
jgi:hypothetical protein